MCDHTYIEWRQKEGTAVFNARMLMHCRFGVSDTRLELRCKNRAHVTGKGRSLHFFSKLYFHLFVVKMYVIYSGEIEILHEIAIALIPPHAKKKNDLRDSGYLFAKG